MGLALMQKGDADEAVATFRELVEPTTRQTSQLD